MTPRNFLIRGLIAGFIAGIAAFGVAHTWGEGPIEAAIAIEEAAPAEPGMDMSEDAGTVVPRPIQSTWGLATGTLAIGTVLGGLTALASAFAVGRIGRMGPGQSTALVAAVGFVSVSLVPALKYGATPPAVGNPDTIGERTGDYFVMVAISVVAAISAVVLARRLYARLGGYGTVVVTGGAYLAVVIAAALLLPTVNEVGDFPASTLWDFRRASLLTLATTWGVIGVVLTGLIGRLYQREKVATDRRDLAASL